MAKNDQNLPATRGQEDMELVTLRETDAGWEKLDRMVSVMTLQRMQEENVGPFQRVARLARGLDMVRQAITDDMMADVMSVMGSSLGFKTDCDWKRRDQWYPPEVVKEVFIEATLRGFQMTGNEINIIKGRFYATKEGLTARIRQFPGLTDFFPTLGVPKRYGAESMLVPCKASWKLKGELMELPLQDIPVVLNKDMGPDAILGKAMRKLMARVYGILTGSEITDGEISDIGAGEPAPAPSPAAAATTSEERSQSPPAAANPPAQDAPQPVQTPQGTTGAPAAGPSAPQNAQGPSGTVQSAPAAKVARGKSKTVTLVENLGGQPAAEPPPETKVVIDPNGAAKEVPASPPPPPPPAAGGPRAAPPTAATSHPDPKEPGRNLTQAEVDAANARIQGQKPGAPATSAEAPPEKSESWWRSPRFARMNMAGLQVPNYTANTENPPTSIIDWIMSTAVATLKQLGRGEDEALLRVTAYFDTYYKRPWRELPAEARNNIIFDIVKNGFPWNDEA